MKRLLVLFAFLLLISTGCALQNDAAAQPTLKEQQADKGVFVRDENVPDLPFADNPDPAACGIPVNWGQDAPAWLTGYYERKLIEPTVYLYDSHLRLRIKGEAPSGSEVRVLLYQQNPTLDYYLVETTEIEPKQQGWVPAPFLSFTPPEN